MIKLGKKYSFTSSTILRINTTINTMPFLKTVLNDILYHLMSSLDHTDDEVRRHAFALAKRPFAKTRYSSHVHFLGKCPRRKLVP